MSGDYAYVTNEEGCDVFLFTTAGECWSTFVEDSTFHTSGDMDHVGGRNFFYHCHTYGACALKTM